MCFKQRYRKKVNFRKLLAFAKLQWEEQSAGTEPNSSLQYHNYKQITPVSHRSLSIAVFFGDFNWTVTSPANLQFPKHSVALDFETAEKSMSEQR